MKNLISSKQSWSFMVVWMLGLALGFSGVVWAADEEIIQVSLGGAVKVASANVAKLAVADPAIADVVPLSDKEISVIGKKAGETTVTVVYSDGQATKMYRVIVGIDPAAKTIRELVGAPNLKVRAVGDTLVLDGQVDCEIQANRAVQIASAYKEKIVNLMEIKQPRQIKIRVRIAEVNMTATRRMGLQWLGNDGMVSYGFNMRGVDQAISPITHGILSADVMLQWLQSKGWARLLSEPTLITRSGSEASFLAGSEVPIVQTLNNVSSVEFKEVGVRMKIKPVADSQNRINTTVHAEVSSISSDVLRGGTVSSTALPVILTRKANATLQLNDGQTMVIGGLLSNDIDTDTLRKFPWLADIPIVGALFRHKDRNQTQRELVFFMTPEIVKDVDAEVLGNTRTPAMKEWNAGATKDVLPLPDQKDDWGLHDLNGLGLPDQPKTTDKLEPGAAPKQNFQSANPAGQ
jgi:pilus assembly protein CpaC